MNKVIVNNLEINIIDIWSSAYWNLKPYLHYIRELDGKSLYKDALNRYYFLTDSRYGKEFYV